MRRAVPVLVGILFALTSCSSGGAAAHRARDRAVASPSADATSPSPAAEHLPRSERMLRSVLAGKGDFVVVPKERYLPMWDELGPKDADYAFDAKNPNGGGLTPMLVKKAAVDEHGDPWFDVYLPIRPNGANGWVPQDEVELQERDDRLEVDLSKRILEHFRDGKLVDRFDVGVGQPQYPTGTGTFYVWVKVPFDNPFQPYGIYALGLSGFSPVISDWPGGGRMAVHGTPNASDRGQAVSHGCVRVYNADMRSLTDLPLGTPVIIHE